MLLVATALAALLAAAPATAAGGEAWSAGLKNLKPQQGRLLLALARDLVPHENLADSRYAACIDPFDAAAADPQARGEIEDALQMALDGSRRMGYTGYLEISDEEERVRLARNLADGRWMRKFKMSVSQCLNE